MITSQPGDIGVIKDHDIAAFVSHDADTDKYEDADEVPDLDLSKYA